MSTYENLAAPIASSPPAGADPSYEPNFQKLNEEIEKISRSGETPNWKLVQSEAAAILRDQAKDTRVACWFVLSSAFVDGWAGLTSALGAFKEIHAAFWDTMHPPVKRAKARAAVVEWLWQSLAAALPKLPVAEKDREAVKGLEQLLFDVNAAVAEKLGNLAPPVGALRAAARQRAADLPPEAPPPPPEPPPGGPPSVRSPAPPPPSRRGTAPAPEIAAPSATADAASLDEAEEQWARWKDPLVSLSYRARQLNPSAAWPYRVPRMFFWLTIDSPPEVAAGSKTYVPPPKPDLVTLLARQLEAGAWDDLREEAEDAFTRNRFWLDVHRYVVIAMENLGPSYASAKAAIMRETATLLTRIPSLSSLQFSNGTPFASGATNGWLLTLTPPTGSGGSGGGGSSPADEALQAAREKLGAGAVDEALGEALLAARKTGEGRDRFRITLGAAQLAHTAGKQRFAMALYEQLLPEVTPALELWDPKLCAEFLLSYLKVLREGPDQNPADERQSLLFRRLLTLDPAIAVRLSV